MTQSKPEPCPEPRKLSELVPFPQQANAFPESQNEAEWQAFVASVAEGLRDLPHVLATNQAGYPPNTIIRGHRRIAALRELGHEVHSVIMRYDLSDVARETIIQEFVLDNLERRMLSPLGRARAIKVLFDAERANHQRRGSSHREHQQLRERVAAAFRMSGRHLDRYLNVLKGPQSIQAALEEGSITLVKAAEVGTAPAELQEEIDRLIKDGTPARAAYNAILLPEKRTHPDNRSLKHVANHFRRAISIISDKKIRSLEKATPGQRAAIADTLATCQRLLSPPAKPPKSAKQTPTKRAEA